MSVDDSGWAVVRLAEDYAVECRDGSLRNPFRLLRNSPNGGVHVYDSVSRNEVSAIVRGDRLRRRRRRPITGSWLIYRNAGSGHDLTGSRYEHGAQGLGATSGYFSGLRPHPDLRADLDAARERPIPDQLRAAGWSVAARMPDGAAEIYVGDDLPVTVHLTADRVALVLLGAWPLQVWQQETRMHAYHLRTPEYVAVPKGMSGGFSISFRGGLDDLRDWHRTSGPDEGGSTGGYSWRLPDRHYHTADGAVVCTRDDGGRADERNAAWPARSEVVDGPGD